MVTLQPMPTYEYRCEACSHQFETFQSIKADRLTDCPKCGQPRLERLISAAAFQLKGGGWYKDLYSSSRSAGSSEPKSGGSSDKKSAA